MKKREPCFIYIVKEYIRSYMFYHNYSKESFCKECGINLETLEKIMCGRLEVSLSDLAKISDFIKVPIARLVIDLNLEKFNNCDKYLFF